MQFFLLTYFCDICCSFLFPVSWDYEAKVYAQFPNILQLLPDPEWWLLLERLPAQIDLRLSFRPIYTRKSELFDDAV